MDGLDGFDAGEVVAVVARQDFGGGAGFAQVVQQGGVAFGQGEAEGGGAAQGEQGVEWPLSISGW